MQDGSASATRHTTASSACGVTDQEFTDFVKTYRVLLTRGLRGCYVCSWKPRPPTGTAYAFERAVTKGDRSRR